MNVPKKCPTCKHHIKVDPTQKEHICERCGVTLHISHLLRDLPSDGKAYGIRLKAA